MNTTETTFIRTVVESQSQLFYDRVSNIYKRYSYCIDKTFPDKKIVIYKLLQGLVRDKTHYDNQKQK